jgi:transposase InsO family protein/transposase
MGKRPIGYYHSSLLQSRRGGIKLVETTEDFSQLRLRFTDPIQHDYELVRPVVLFAQPIAARSRETDTERSTVGDRARRFVTGGMLGLVDQRKGRSGRKGHQYPEPVANYILYLKQLYPPIAYREIARIMGRKFGYKTNHHTVKSFLTRHPIPMQLEFALETFHEFEDAYQARWTVVRMCYEGWKKQSIAGLLKLSVRHVARLIKAFERDGFAGLEDKRTRPPNHPHNQLTLPFLEEVFAVQQEYPRAGRFRVHGLLEKKLGEDTPSEGSVGRAMAYNRVLKRAPGPWPPPPPDRSGEEPKPLPYQPLYPHHYWFIDIRYLVKLDGRWTYSICIIEGYSRNILAGMASQYQDELVILQLLHAAFSEYGAPEGLVSDNGSVFTAHVYDQLLQKLEIEPCYIEKRQSWQNLIEAQFKIQLRLADAKFEQAVTLDEIQEQHAAFIQIFNTTNHWAHRNREDDHKTPVAVLGWQRGRALDPDTLRQAFRHLQFPRVVNRHGLVSVQRFYIYAERGLARKRVAVWIYEGRLHIEYQQTLLARYLCRIDQRRRRLKSVSRPQIYRTLFVSPQLELFELDEEQWRRAWLRPPYVYRNAKDSLAKQLPLLGLEFALWLFCSS